MLVIITIIVEITKKNSDTINNNDEYLFIAVCQVSSKAEIADLYVKSCAKHRTQPLKNILEHLNALDLHLQRQPLLSLKGIPLTPNDCEPLEEIFMRVGAEAFTLECNYLMLYYA